ncbi:hypothetical protein CERSUDRAFT_115566 [Gelatoporia subvermispora B]|uniref:Uncharacterized protein n=1 Tax=Ceriporiopsis subvermispora (strain B) TaxID=914234 RepID=M2Q4Z9_CERS8|nr:hypothetical protein CERSUDRAFT_88459 [Gelatoporia subvermispora B]EMD35746.1 hypothetical protein CERSUDRAFT_115694 [Gelatoporia subvermispora B]EMD36519.1 hypothetical protein CERSUDRAFT_115566 [Gelatoporia subvermispora B]
MPSQRARGGLGQLEFNLRRHQKNPQAHDVAVYDSRTDNLEYLRCHPPPLLCAEPHTGCGTTQCGVVTCGRWKAEADLEHQRSQWGNERGSG